MNDDRSSAFRPLRAVSAEITALRSGTLDDARRTSAVLRVADAVDASLRRLLRDDPAASQQVRLRALAPDELRSEEVLAELRQHDRISIELAAVVHELMRARQRGAAEPADSALALRAVEQLEREIGSLSAPPARSQDHALSDETLVHPVPPAPTARRRMPRWAWWLAAAALLLLLVVGGRRLLDDADAQHMDQGIALFRSGAYADAAHHFYRYAQQNPEDVTPRLYLARIHRRMGRPQLAGPELQEALRLAPDDPAVHRELGFLLLDAGQNAVAVERFRTAVSMDRESAEGWIGLIRALRAGGHAGAAERALAQAPERVRELLQARGTPSAAQLP